jgi:hypothetical protein
MRRVVLSVWVNERERPHAFVRHSTTTSKMILRRRALPKYDRPFHKDSYPRTSDQPLLEEQRSTMRRLAACGPLRHAHWSDMETGVCHKLGGSGK